jgi:hypothetical protein
MRTILTLLLFLLPCTLHASEVPARARVIDFWHYERLVDGKVADSGTLGVDPATRQMLTDLASDGGSLSFLIEGREYEADEPAPLPFAAAAPRYVTQLRGRGSIAALQHTPGEIWRFTLGDVTVTERQAVPVLPARRLEVEGYLGGEINLGTEFSTAANGWMLLQVGHGEHELVPMLLYAPPGAEDAEAPPEFKGHVWVEVPLPAGFGRVFGLALAVGAEWKVRIDGEEYAATSTAEDPTFGFDRRRID